METDKNLDKVGIGTMEKPVLSAVPIQVQGHRIEDVTKKNEEKVIGKKVVLICKHPEMEDLIELSKVKYLKNDRVVVSGLWFNQDEDGLIPKISALAETMRKYGCIFVEDFDGKEINTDLDGNFLVVKAY